MTSRVVFLDKDGTLVENLPYNVRPEQMTLARGVNKALTQLCLAGYRLVVITNQSGIARGYFTEQDLWALAAGLQARLRTEVGVSLSGFYYCPHHPGGIVSDYALKCDCRKPQPGLILRAARDLDVDLGNSWFIGDILDDVEAGNRAGCRTILIDNGSETEWKQTYIRQPDFIVNDLEEAAAVILRGTSVENDARRGDKWM
jgi:D,D-heptose 1,7-bisphosphate phosphatase